MLKKLSVSVFLAVLLSIPAMAGDVETPGKTEPPPQPPQGTPLRTTIYEEMLLPIVIELTTRR